MKITNQSTQDLEEMANLLLEDVKRISYDWHTRLPAIKALLIQVENELYNREK